jgi:hypothetical protein
MLLDSLQSNPPENIMQTIPSEARRQHTVRATFEDGMSTFRLSCDATLEELAGHLGHLAEQHQCRPISFDLKLASLSH